MKVVCNVFTSAAAMHSEILLIICSQIENTFMYVFFFNSNTKDKQLWYQNDIQNDSFDKQALIKRTVMKTSNNLQIPFPDWKTHFVCTDSF